MESALKSAMWAKTRTKREHDSNHACINRELAAGDIFIIGRGTFVLTQIVCLRMRGCKV